MSKSKSKSYSTSSRTDHGSLVERGKEAIQNVFGDTTVSREQTYRSLTELREEIQDILNTMDEEDGNL